MKKQWPDKIIVGLTGNIATGKSVVMRMASERGALTLDADKVVHDILDHNPEIQATIEAAFGRVVRRNDHGIDRAALASIVFQDESKLQELEEILHPAVGEEIVRRIDHSEARVVVIEAIKLLEGGLAQMCDEIWVTTCPRELQIQRLMICRGMDAETAIMRVDAQNPQEAKVARADVVINTAGTLAETEAQFERAWNRLANSNLRSERKGIDA